MGQISTGVCIVTAGTVAPFQVSFSSSKSADKAYYMLQLYYFFVVPSLSVYGTYLTS